MGGWEIFPTIHIHKIQLPLQYRLSLSKKCLVYKIMKICRYDSIIFYYYFFFDPEK